MLLSAPGILKHLQKGNIIIDPFDERKLKSASYDVTLGEWHWREQHPGARSSLYNPYDDKMVKIVWGEEPFQAELAADVMSRHQMELVNIKPTERVIMLSPGETILAHTEEFIGGRRVCIGKLYARSSLGRNFIEVCKDAGWGDVGYFNRWTMEVTNNSRYFSIPLVVGRRIGQMVFYEVEPPSGDRDDYAKNGKYQSSSEIEQLKTEWNPNMMLPRMHKDWEVFE
jgi:dCTP deaminase